MNINLWNFSRVGHSIRRAGTTLASAALLAFLMAGCATTAQAPEYTTAASAPEMEVKAIDALKNMGAYLRTLKSFSAQVDVTQDEVLESGQKVQFTRAMNVHARRPDRMRIDAVGDLKQRQLYYDGKTVSVFDSKTNYYASVAAPPIIGGMIAAISEKYNLEMPLVDLFLWGTDQSGIDDIKSAIYIGESRVGGVLCDHYAYRQDDVDWQLWIERGKKPLPRKLVITTLDEPSQPQFTAVLKWDLAAKQGDKKFSFTPPKGAQKIELAPLPAAK